MKSHGSRASSDLLLLMTAAIWGFAFVAQRAGMQHIGPFWFNAVRFGTGALLVLPLAFRSGSRETGSFSAQP
jgi:drug/metabolite transporter (DMT)-like permease